MLSQRKHQNTNALAKKCGKNTPNPKEDAGFINFIPLPYNFLKGLVPMGHIFLTTIFVSSLWYYLAPSGNYADKSMDYKKESFPLTTANSSILEEKIEETPKIINQKKQAIVEVYPPIKKAKKLNSVSLYNQAIKNDKLGHYKSALHLYRQALAYKNSKIQKNAKGIRQRISYLVHHKVNP